MPTDDVKSVELKYLEWPHYMALLNCLGASARYIIYQKSPEMGHSGLVFDYPNVIIFPKLENEFTNST